MRIFFISFFGVDSRQFQFTEGQTSELVGFQKTSSLSYQFYKKRGSPVPLIAVLDAKREVRYA